MTKISDAKLAEMGREREALKRQLAEINFKLDNVDDKIIGELERRGTDVIENDGIRITRVQQQMTIYDWDALKLKVKPSIRKLCEKTVFDPKGLSAAVQQGLVPIKLVAHYTDRKPKKPYVTVSEVVT